MLRIGHVAPYWPVERVVISLVPGPPIVARGCITSETSDPSSVGQRIGRQLRFCSAGAAVATVPGATQQAHSITAVPLPQHSVRYQPHHNRGHLYESELR
jgi:hypothetical protein